MNSLLQSTPNSPKLNSPASSDSTFHSSLYTGRSGDQWTKAIAADRQKHVTHRKVYVMIKNQNNMVETQTRMMKTLINYLMNDGVSPQVHVPPLPPALVIAERNAENGKVFICNYAGSNGPSFISLFIAHVRFFSAFIAGDQTTPPFTPPFNPSLNSTFSESNVSFAGSSPTSVSSYNLLKQLDFSKKSRKEMEEFDKLLKNTEPEFDGITRAKFVSASPHVCCDVYDTGMMKYF
jgi:hypothetical protein